MKISSFRASKVFGHMDYDIRFNDDLNFLVGKNGSGKTTVLRLINGVLQLNPADLLAVQFESIEIVVDNDAESHRGVKRLVFKALDKNDHIAITVSNSRKELSIPKYIPSNEHRAQFIDYDDPSRLNSRHPVVVAIQTLPKISVLTVERRTVYENGSATQFVKYPYLMYGEPSRYSNAGNLDSIGEVRSLTQDYYETLQSEGKKLSEDLRNQILSSSFEYAAYTGRDTSPNAMIAAYNEIRSKKEQILEAVEQLGDISQQLSRKLDVFFRKMEQLHAEHKASNIENKPMMHIEWLMNKAQFDQILAVSRSLDDYKAKYLELMRPLDDFIDTMNSFYHDSDKHLVIDNVGRLRVELKKGGGCPLDSLSSGERQLLIIMAHAFLGRDRKRVFIVDEPELSLHLIWQQKFTESLVGSQSSSQFILATHSPEILANNEDKVVVVKGVGAV